MVQDDRGQLFVTEACHHLGAVHWVTFDEIELRVGEPGRLIENLSWNAELADIVNQRGSANRLNLAAGETHLAGDASGIASHAIGVTPGVSILGFQRGRQSPEKFLLAVDRPSCRTPTVTLHEAEQLNSARQPSFRAPAPQPSPDKQFAEQQISRSLAALPVRTAKPRQSGRESHRQDKPRPRPDRARRAQQPNHNDRRDRDEQSGESNLRQVARERPAGPVVRRTVIRGGGRGSTHGIRRDGARRCRLSRAYPGRDRKLVVRSCC